jgi:hypothetical protein
MQYADGGQVGFDLERARALLAEAAEVRAKTAALVGQSRELCGQARQTRSDMRVLRDRHAELAAEAREALDRAS